VVLVPGGPAPAISGLTLDGDAVKLDFESRTDSATLLAFLGTGCATCATFWAGPGGERMPADVRTVIVTHGEDRESPSRLRRLAPADVPAIMSSEAFSDYGVSGTPYFVLVRRTVRGAGMASSWRALASLVADAIADARPPAVEPKRAVVPRWVQLVLLPLAVTSTQGWQKRLGFRRWKSLHRLVYAAGVLGCIHFLWRFKLKEVQPIVYGIALLALLGIRVIDWARKRTRTARIRASTSPAGRISPSLPSRRGSRPPPGRSSTACIQSSTRGIRRDGRRFTTRRRMAPPMRSSRLAGPVMQTGTRSRRRS